jgi:hypothetical protein
MILIVRKFNKLIINSCCWCCEREKHKKLQTHTHTHTKECHYRLFHRNRLLNSLSSTSWQYFVCVSREREWRGRIKDINAELAPDDNGNGCRHKNQLHSIILQCEMREWQYCIFFFHFFFVIAKLFHRLSVMMMLIMRARIDFSLLHRHHHFNEMSHWRLIPTY